MTLYYSYKPWTSVSTPVCNLEFTCTAHTKRGVSRLWKIVNTNHAAKYWGNQTDERAEQGRQGRQGYVRTGGRADVLLQ
jgi:hypothetical protein